MKHLPVLLIVPALLTVCLAVRPEPGPSAATASPPAGAEAPAPPPLRQAAHDAAAEPSGESALLEARVALRCGRCLEDEAGRHRGETARALLDLAARQYQACLAHEAKAGEPFGDARRRLEQTKSLLARSAPPPVQETAKAAPAPAPKAAAGEPETRKVAPAPEPPVARTAPRSARRTPLMVGPDGVIYEKVGGTGRAETKSP